MFFVFLNYSVKMSYNIRRRVVVNQKVGIDLIYDYEVFFKLGLRSRKVLFFGYFESCNVLFFQVVLVKNCREDVDCCIIIVFFDYYTGFEGEIDMDQELICDELSEEIFRDIFFFGYIDII